MVNNFMIPKSETMLNLFNKWEEKQKNINSLSIIRRVNILYPEQCLDAVCSVSKLKVESQVGQTGYT